MNIHTPSVPARFRITQTMADDFLCDPVLGAHCFFGFKLDAFQRARLRLMWWVPELIDSSGFSSGKTVVDWAYVNLRCILLPDHHAGVYYPTFETMKNTFFGYYRSVYTPIFKAQLGRLDDRNESDKVQGAACFKAFYRSGGQVLMPAPSFMKQAATQASLRLNTLLVEEWTHIDAASDGINAQLIGRVTRESWNQHHPVWGNHITFTAPAKSQMHPAYQRYYGTLRAAQSGNPKFGVCSFSYKDYSAEIPSNSGKSFRDRFRVQGTIDSLRAKFRADRAGWLGEGLGFWARSGTGWFTEEAIMTCVELGRRRQVLPILSRAE